MVIRRRLELDQEQFGKLLGVARAYVSRLENGHFAISDQVAGRLAEIEAAHGINARTKMTDGDMVLAEDQAPYGETEHLRVEIRRKVEDSIRAAGGDRIKLGWLLSQINEHTRPQAHWTDAEGRERYEQIRARALAEKGRRGGDPLGNTG